MMSSSTLMNKMFELNADGVDFHPIMLKSEIGTLRMKIYESYTKDELVNVKYVPKTSYTFWKMIDGHKEYMLD